MTNFNGSISEGIREGSYQRLQEGIKIPTPSIQLIREVIEDRLHQFTDSPNPASRLDLRILSSVPTELLPELKLSQKYEIDYITNPTSNHEETIEIHIGYNRPERQITDSERIKVTSQILSYTQRQESNHTTESFERYALSELERFYQQGYSFVTNEDLTDVDLERLWGDTFDLQINDCLSILTTNKVYAIRHPKGRIIATLLHDNYETTEWAVDTEFRKQRLISPLLIFSNSKHILAEPNEPLYAHLRYNRSLSAGLRSGFRVSLLGTQNNFLSNHVAVEGNLTHFQTGTLDPNLYSEEVINQYTQ